MERLATIDRDDSVYADEAGMDNRDDYGYGWNQRGESFHALIPGRRQGRVNMSAADCHRQLIAPFTIEGACNRIVFDTWIEKSLMAALKPGQWLVIDNATFHKRGRIAALLEQVGCQVLYLPLYSPALNKIEQCWSWLHLSHPSLQERV